MGIFIVLFNTDELKCWLNFCLVMKVLLSVILSIVFLAPHQYKHWNCHCYTTAWIVIFSISECRMRSIEFESSVAFAVVSAICIMWMLRQYHRWSSTSQKQSTRATFGHDLRKQHFCIDANVYQCNNGSFGAVPRPVLEKQQRLVDPALYLSWNFQQMGAILCEWVYHSQGAIIRSPSIPW